MKKINHLLILSCILYVVLGALLILTHQQAKNIHTFDYKAEINRILGTITPAKLEENSYDLSSFSSVKQIKFLPIETMDKDSIAPIELTTYQNGFHTSIQPYVKNKVLLGYLRFDYVISNTQSATLLVSVALLSCLFLFLVITLIYVKYRILKPFHQLSEMPYELSKGHLKTEVYESKDKFFGKFIWGMNMLKDTLANQKGKEIELEKEKKLLLLSLSHDMKTPLNLIKLQAKALEEGLYDQESEKQSAAASIQVNAAKIDSFVTEIIKTSTNDLFMIEVHNTEFYLYDLIHKIQAAYTEICQRNHIPFNVHLSENRLLHGDFDRSFEVLENLMENAIKYGDGSLISITCYEEDGCQLIKVSNHGTCISNNEFHHLFDSFYRGSNAQNKPGYGLGLYICRIIMNKMEGEIYAGCETAGMSFTLVFR